MSSRRHNRRALLATLALVVLLATVILFEVLWTVFFAITVAYVLSPIRERLAARGLSPRLASGFATLIGFASVLVLFAPLALTLYQRRTALLGLAREIPETITIEIGEFAYAIHVPGLREPAQEFLTAVAVDLARGAPVLATKLFLFAFVVYGLLLRPGDTRQAALALVPAPYHDIVFALHRRVRATLFALYLLQAATAVVTFVLALIVFWIFGYESPFVLAVIAGILQFIPILGPSLLIAALAGFDLAFGEATRALAILVVGLIVVGFLPDALVRPRLAARTARLPASVYFIGFTGGLLSVGVVGIIAGPLVVALLVEVVDLLSTE